MERKLVNNWKIILCVIHVRPIMYKSSLHFIYCIIRFKNWFKRFAIWDINISTKFSVVLQSFCQNQNPDQDQDENHYFTLDFNTRTIVYT